MASLGRWSVLLCPLLLMGAGACGEERHVDSFCVFGGEAPEGHAYSAGEPLAVRVRFSGCLNSCEEANDKECDVEVDGSTVNVDGRATVRQKSPGGCGNICELIFTTCEVSPLNEGSFEFSTGDEAVTVEIPSVTEEPYCTGNSLRN